MATLLRGSTGPEVTALQQRLLDLGFDPNGVDGNFGPGTESAVKAFQQAQGLTVDGKVGPMTRAALQPTGGGGTASSSREKILWVVDYNSLAQFIQRAVAAKVTAVAVRTSNNMPEAIAAAHAANLKIYGWRWPSAQPNGAMAEANRAATLLTQGLDGYFADPEGEPGQPFDWNQPGLADLANQFCTTIKSAAGTKPLGVTSHFLAKQRFPNLPWAAFFQHADVLLPQAYWRVSDGPVHHANPVENFRDSIQAWVAAGGVKEKIQPMAGELRRVTGAEIGQYVGEANNQGITTLHFYTDEAGITEDVWNAIAQA
jgi:Putative peptidoglycan binding domain